ncbi:MAG: class I SAM-dependent methyltransferase [Phycisphaerae bacterium]|nr:class I SAM-dependent methyltransferase [Phycisphaerae bacterium]
MGLLDVGPSAYREGSLLWRFRARRFNLFVECVREVPRPLRIIDIGGTNEFWEAHGWAGRNDVHIVLVNLHCEAHRHANVEPAKGNATDLSLFPDGSFDIAFSNSTIEHLFTFGNQKLMAQEMRRVGRSYWLQTPNFWFPIEPHFRVLGWQWLPRRLRIALLRRYRCGWRGPCPDPSAAERAIDEIRLLTAHELHVLFPNAVVLPERFCGFVKSWIAIGGLPVGPASG